MTPGVLFHGNFEPSHNRTKISRLSPPPATHVYQAGLVLLRTATSQGTLAVEY